MTDFDLDERGGALWLTLHRPPVNVLDIATLREVRRALKGLPTRRDLKVLVSRVVDDLEAATADWVSRLAAKSGSVLALARRAVRQGARGTLPKALARTERLYLEEVTRTRDSEEGVEAFLEKRRPRWTDR